MKHLLSRLLGLAIVAGIIAAPLALSTTVAAGSPAEDITKGVQAASGGSQQAGADDFNKALKTIVDTMLFLLGAVAVIMIIIGGIRYTTSNGEASSMQAAKNTILYAVVGLVVAIMAYAIVNFFINAFSK